MNSYITEGMFLAKRAYTLTDKKTGEVKDNTTYDVLVYDKKTDTGLEKPRIASVTVPTCDEASLKDFKLLEEVLLTMELSFDKQTGTLKPKFTAIDHV